MILGLAPSAFLIRHPVQLRPWLLSPDARVSAAFLFVGLEIKYEKIETFSESFKTQLSFPSRSWRPFDSIEVVGFSPCLNLGSVSGLT